MAGDMNDIGIARVAYFNRGFRIDWQSPFPRVHPARSSDLLKRDFIAIGPARRGNSKCIRGMARPVVYWAFAEMTLSRIVLTVILTQRF